jgi:uncharacterized membrane protein
MKTHTNKYGRRPGRGLRPWVLIPKVLSVAALFGGFLSACVLLHTSRPQTHEQWGHLIESVGVLFRYLIVPAVLCVILFGILLLLMHFRAFLSMRWVWLKLSLLLVTLPPLHLAGRWLIGQARLALEAGDLQRVAELMGQFTLTADLAVLVLVVVVVVGRHKPRLGQRPKTVAQQRAASKPQA